MDLLVRANSPKAPNNLQHRAQKAFVPWDGQPSMCRIGRSASFLFGHPAPSSGVGNGTRDPRTGLEALVNEDLNAEGVMMKTKK